MKNLLFGVLALLLGIWCMIENLNKSDPVIKMHWKYNETMQYFNCTIGVLLIIFGLLLLIIAAKKPIRIK